MASKPIVILVHGMGKHKPGEFKKEFTESINYTLNRITDYESADINNLLEIKAAIFTMM